MNKRETVIIKLHPVVLSTCISSTDFSLAAVAAIRKVISLLASPKAFAILVMSGWPS